MTAEDLELLAKAAEATGHVLGPGWDQQPNGILINGTGAEDGELWNPLDDDGAALLLSALHDFTVSSDEASCRVSGVAGAIEQTYPIDTATGLPDSRLAMQIVRRAIVMLVVRTAAPK